MAPQSPSALAYPNLCFDINTPEDKEKLEILISGGVDINSSASDIIKIKCKQIKNNQ